MPLQRDEWVHAHVQERKRNGEFARDEEGQVNQAGGGAAGVAAWVAAEAVGEELLGVVAAGHAAADGRRDEAVAVVGAGVADVGAAHHVVGPVGEIGVAAGEGVGARLAEPVLHAVGDEPDAGEGEGEPEPADVQLPQLAAPHEAPRRAARHRVARHEHEGDEQDGEDGDAAVEEDEEPRGDSLVLCEGESGG